MQWTVALRSQHPYVYQQCTYAQTVAGSKGHGAFTIAVNGEVQVGVLGFRLRRTQWRATAGPYQIQRRPLKWRNRLSSSRSCSSKGATICCSSQDVAVDLTSPAAA